MLRSKTGRCGVALVAWCGASFLALTALAAPPADSVEQVITNWRTSGGAVTIQLDGDALARIGASTTDSAWAFVVDGEASNIELSAADGQPRSLAGDVVTQGQADFDVNLGPDGAASAVGNMTVSVTGLSARVTDGLDIQRDLFIVVPGTLAFSFDEAGQTVAASGQLVVSDSLAHEILGNGELAGLPVGALSIELSVKLIDFQELTQHPVENFVPENPGGNVIVGDLTGPANWGSFNGVVAYSIGTTSCNIGTAPLDWFDEVASRHPVISQNVFRLKTEPGTNYMRFEHIGQSWLKYSFCALQQNLCGTCQPVGACCCSQLGVNCSDPYTASRNGSFSLLGPKWQVNGATGEFPEPQASPTGNTTLRGRINIQISDIINQPTGTLYYGEAMYVARDDAGNNLDNNNCSWRRVAFSSTPPSYNMSFIGSTVRQEPAIFTWQDNDPGVTLVNVDVPTDADFTVNPGTGIPPDQSSRIIVGYRVTQNADGTWHYEYAVFNQNCHRSVRSVSMTTGSSCSVTNVGFHDVDYHSGDVVVGTDWASSVAGGTITWSTDAWTSGNDLTVNAIRFGTLYNFRFDSDMAPTPGTVTLGLFRPPNDPGEPTAMTFTGQVPKTLAAGDINGDGAVNNTDRDLFVQVLLDLNHNACQIMRCDFNGGGVDGTDIPFMVDALIP